MRVFRITFMRVLDVPLMRALGVTLLMIVDVTIIEIFYQTFIRSVDVLRMNKLNLKAGICFGRVAPLLSFSFFSFAATQYILLCVFLFVCPSLFLVRATEGTSL